MIGLSVMRAYLTGAMPSHLRNSAGPIWISLDDYRGWFSSGKGKVADAIAVTILDTGEDFELLLQVGEAKFVGMQNELAETKEALKQVRATMDRLARIFIDNEDEISRAAWCTRLVNLLVDREGLSERIPDSLRRAAFLEQMVAGDVRFRMSGEAVVCLHDFHATPAKMERDVDFPHLRYLVLPTPLIRKTLHAIEEGGLPELDGLTDVRWYPESPTLDADVPEDGRGDPVAAPREDEAACVPPDAYGEEPEATESSEQVAVIDSSIEAWRPAVDELPETSPGHGSGHVHSRHSRGPRCLRIALHSDPRPRHPHRHGFTRAGRDRRSGLHRVGREDLQRHPASPQPFRHAGALR